MDWADLDSWAKLSPEKRGPELGPKQLGRAQPNIFFFFLISGMG
jgi:hypothetical protein